jgi:hypothetical protein
LWYNGFVLVNERDAFTNWVKTLRGIQGTKRVKNYRPSAIVEQRCEAVLREQAEAPVLVTATLDKAGHRHRTVTTEETRFDQVIM